MGMDHRILEHIEVRPFEAILQSYPELTLQF
jgi:hypothetical protein